MSSTTQLDLIGVLGPVGLLKFTGSLSRLKPKDRLEILITDPDVVLDLILITERSNDRVVASEEIADHYRIVIEKE